MFLVVFVVLMSFFVYDVDIYIVKGDDEQEPPSQEPWGPSGRVVVRNEQQDGQSLRARMTSVNLV